MGKSEDEKLKLRKSYPFAHPRQIPRQKNTNYHLNIIKNKGEKKIDARIDLREKKEKNCFHNDTAIFGIFESFLIAGVYRETGKGYLNDFLRQLSDNLRKFIRSVLDSFSFLHPMVNRTSQLFFYDYTKFIYNYSL